MKTDEPSVAILMAVYNPQMDWFREQLESLNNQTYGNIKLYVLDDCSPSVPFGEIKKAVEECITAFPYEIGRNDQNYGSNVTFERLTGDAESDYFSYCDQDDVWHNNKIEQCVDAMQKTGASLVCSDMNIIDGNGKKIANSITSIRKRHVFLSGEGLAGHLLINNFVTGCTMMVKSEIAKKCMPFVKTMIHDQWIAINAADTGVIHTIMQPLLDYRQHGGNQTAILANVTDKKSYYEERILNYRERLSELRERICNENVTRTINELSVFYDARMRYFSKPSVADFKIMQKYREIAKSSVLLESVMKLIPEFVFKKITILAKKGII